MTRSIIRISKGGYDHQGLTALFEAEFSDGTKETFECPSDAIGQVVSELRMVGQMAETARKNMPGTPFELARTYNATDIRTGSDQTGQVIVRFSTQDGIPVDIAMPQAVARNAIERLGVALRQSQSKPANKN